ncbi:uncharacterized protein LOC141900734 isoform X1 [Tubulanus polymorphus]|uniref:uncharacterized protein LOC141900734 isoform X1 n=1 Tax=Tubulanus polymorphus TaxID=672921 RepID=UPI003DA655B3
MKIEILFVSLILLTVFCGNGESRRHHPKNLHRRQRIHLKSNSRNNGENAMSQLDRRKYTNQAARLEENKQFIDHPKYIGFQQENSQAVNTSDDGEEKLALNDENNYAAIKTRNEIIFVVIFLLMYCSGFVMVLGYNMTMPYTDEDDEKVQEMTRQAIAERETRVHNDKMRLYNSFKRKYGGKPEIRVESPTPTTSTTPVQSKRHALKRIGSFLRSSSISLPRRANSSSLGVASSTKTRRSQPLPMTTRTPQLSPKKRDEADYDDDDLNYRTISSLNEFKRMVAKKALKNRQLSVASVGTTRSEPEFSFEKGPMRSSVDTPPMKTSPYSSAATSVEWEFGGADSPLLDERKNDTGKTRDENQLSEKEPLLQNADENSSAIIDMSELRKSLEQKRRDFFNPPPPQPIEVIVKVDNNNEPNRSKSPKRNTSDASLKMPGVRANSQVRFAIPVKTVRSFSAPASPILPEKDPSLFTPQRVKTE